MRKLQCELCGSNDIAKEGQFFVCQYCGCKYTLEDMRANISLSGSVSLDDSESRKRTAENCIQLAIAAYKNQDMVEALDYSNKALEADSNNHEAWAIKAKALAWLSTLDDRKFNGAVHAAQRAIELCPTSKEMLAQCIYDIAKIRWGVLAKMALMARPTTVMTLHLHALMLDWVALLKGIPHLPQDLVSREIAECEKLCKAPRFGIGTSALNINVASAWKRLNNGRPYSDALKDLKAT